jgi:hypothetical protein
MWVWQALLGAFHPGAFDYARTSPGDGPLAAVVGQQLTLGFMVLGCFYIVLFYLRIFKYIVSPNSGEEDTPVGDLAGRGE